MRLSEKGCVHLNEWMVHKLPIDAFEFKPEDFTNCVVLTVEEAKDFLGWLYNSKWKWEHQTDTEFAEDWRKDWIRYLEERIEQAEKKQ